MYKVVFTERAIRDLKKLGPEARKRIIKKIKVYSTSPDKYSVKLSHPKIGNYRFKIGDYRVIFDVIEKNIVVLRIGHRKEIYR